MQFLTWRTKSLFGSILFELFALDIIPLHSYLQLLIYLCDSYLSRSTNKVRQSQKTSWPTSPFVWWRRWSTYAKISWQCIEMSNPPTSSLTVLGMSRYVIEVPLFSLFFRCHDGTLKSLSISFIENGKEHMLSHLLWSYLYHRLIKIDIYILVINLVLNLHFQTPYVRSIMALPFACYIKSCANLLGSFSVGDKA